MTNDEGQLAGVRISETHYHALNNDAVITIPFHLPEVNFKKYGLIPGGIVHLRTQEGNNSVPCRVLDIESTTPLHNNLFSIRVTLRKSREQS